MMKGIWMSDEEYKLVTDKSVIPCVDLVVLREIQNSKYKWLSDWEVALFIRATGYERGKWCVIGGRQFKGEVANEVIKRQALEMGIEVAVIPPFEPNFPAWQYDNPEQDRTKHSSGSVYPVRILHGEINPAGQEYGAYRWFSVKQLPEDAQWAYHHKFEVQKAVEQVKRFGTNTLVQRLE